MAKLKDLRVILSIILVLTWIVVGVGFFLYHKWNTELVAEKDGQISDLEYSLEQIGELVPAYVVSTDVKMGKKIEDVDLTPIQVPLSMSTNLVTDMEDLIGKHFRMDLTQGTVITEDSVLEFELTDDMRLLDVVLHTVPIGIKPGSIVDVRISLPMGEDFIAMAHKRVYDINAGIMKIVVNENDIHSYNSMLVDALMYPGTQLYAVEYVEGLLQDAGEVYYPVSSNVLAIAQRDPNLLEAVKADILQRRNMLEENLSSIALTNLEPDELERILERGRERHIDSFEEAARYFERAEEKREDERRAAEREAARNE